MAFELYNWSQVSTSLNQGVISAAIATETGDSVIQQGSGNLFSYFSPNDTVAEIGASNYFLEMIRPVLPIIMIAVSIDAFHNQIISIANFFRISEEWRGSIPKIASEQNLERKSSGGRRRCDDRHFNHR